MKEKIGRVSYRKPVNIIIRLSGEVAEGIMHLPSSDVGVGGVFIESDLIFEIGEIVDMEFYLPGEKEPIKVKGQVVRANKERVEKGDPLMPGMGVRFIDLSSEGKERIRQYLSRG